jgi:hypothetical protein
MMDMYGQEVRFLIAVSRSDAVTLTCAEIRRVETIRLSHRIGRQLDTATLSMINGGALVCGRYGLHWRPDVGTGCAGPVLLTAVSVKKPIF